MKKRLLEICHSDAKLYLIFGFHILVAEGKCLIVLEFLDMDLKKYMDSIPQDGTGLEPEMIKKFTFQLMNGLL